MRSLKSVTRAFCLTLLLLASVQTTAHAIDLEFPSDRAFKVTVETVRENRIESMVVGTGTVAAWRELPISTEANAAAVVEVRVDEGDIVEKDQLLARLDNRVLEAQREQNRAAVSEAEANLATALSDQNRAHAVARGVISQQIVEQRETLVKTAAAKLAFARAVLDETEAKLRQTSILAPANAFVAVRNVTIGQVVQPGTELFRLIQDRRIEVNALVPEADLLRIKPQQSARIFDALGRQSRGSVRTVAPVVDDKTRLGTVRLALPLGTDLKLGMFVRAEIEVGTTLSVMVPTKALVWRDGRPAVFTVTHDETAGLRLLTIGRRTSVAIEILQGLSVGERIVIDGAGLVRDGEKVRFDVAAAPAPSELP